MTIRIAALEYERALEELCSGKLDQHLGPKDERGRPVFGVPDDVYARLAQLRAAAVREYAAALEADERQRIAERLKGWT